MAKQKEKPVKIPIVTVDVTQADIDTAIPKDSSHCMVADALKRCYKQKFGRPAKQVSVDLQTIRMGDDEQKVRIIWLTPQIAQNGLIQFDQGQTVAPFKFTLRDSYVQVIPYQKRKGDNTSPPAKKKKRRPAARINARSTVKRTRVVITGGSAPPRAILTGRQRRFGLKMAGKV